MKAVEVFRRAHRRVEVALYMTIPHVGEKEDEAVRAEFGVVLKRLSGLYRAALEEGERGNGRA